MSPRSLLGFWLASLVAALLLPVCASAQRVMENLGRGLVVVRTSSTQTYLSWRLLGTEPSDIAFNVYRSVGTGAPVLLNPTPLTATTDYRDTPGTPALVTGVSYQIRPVIGGVEQAGSPSYSLAPDAPTRQFLTVPLQTPPGAFGPYDVKFCWVGDFDGNGEYDFLVDRVSTTSDAEQYLEAYLADGTFLWRMNMGPNSIPNAGSAVAYEPGPSAISIGDTDNVTVYDLDGDGRAEVLVRTANGVTVTNAAGTVVTTVTAASNSTQFVSAIDGLAGTELSRITLPNPWSQHGTLTNKCAIAYFDGFRPSVLFYGYNRANSGQFYRVFTAFDYRNGALTQRWTLAQNTSTMPGSEGHQIRIADVDNDGRDEVCDIGHVIDDNGTQLFYTDLTHGDRFHITDIDPDLPGLESYAIQQNNPTLLATVLHRAQDGAMLKRWYAATVVDVGRGIAIDINSTHKGLEVYSTQPGIYNAQGDQIYANNVWAPEGLWWDGDLLREFIDGAGSGALNPVINKFNQTTGNTDRLWTLYSDNGDFSTHQAYGGRPAFWGDILGDWREELVLVTSDYSALRIYTTTISATNRLYTLMHNPQYRCQATTKGYVQASYTDYYLGVGMTTPPPPPINRSNLAWQGGSGLQTWSTATASFLRNGVASAFVQGDSVRFDAAGNSASTISVSGTVQPSDVIVYGPSNYTLGGAGSIGGTTKVTKAGSGSLTFPAGTLHGYTGVTTIWDGAFVVNGTLAASPVTVWGGTWGGAAAAGVTGGRLAGTGQVTQPVALQYRGAITPGAATGGAGTLTIGSLTAVDGAALDFELSDDTTGTTKANDKLIINGSLSLSGTVSVVVKRLNGLLSPGTYTLATYSGALTGSVSNLSLVAPDGVPCSLALAGGALTLTVTGTRAPASITWAGGLNANLWDLASTGNWRLNGAQDVFVSGDAVTFDDTGAANPSLVLNASAPVASMTVSGTTNYTITGTGAIAGSGGLTKSGTGTLTLATANTFTGPTSISGGTVSVAALSAAGVAGPFGAATGAVGNWTIDGATLRMTGPQTNTDRTLVVGAGGATFDVTTNGVSLTLGGAVSGTGSLTKAGNGSMTLGTTNSYSGGTYLTRGTLAIGTAGALGSGPITLSGGVFATGSLAPQNPIVVTAAARITGGNGGGSHGIKNVSGSGVLTLEATNIFDLEGDMSGFTGTVALAGTSGFRLFGSSGSAAADWDFGTRGVNARSGTAFALGSLTGTSTASLTGASGTGNTANVTYTIGANGHDTTFAGVISNGGGSTLITKTGTGTLTLSGANTYTGNTTVSGGRLLVTGSLGATNVTVQSGAGLGGTGTLGGNLTLNTGSQLVVTPGAGALSVAGNVTASGTITIVPGAGASLAAGTYPVLNYTGTLSGAPTFAWSGSGWLASFSTATAGVVNVTLTPDYSRAPATVTWTGATGSTWDTSTTPSTFNWSWTGGATFFQTGDSVVFNDSSAVTAVTLTGTLSPAAVTVASSLNHTFSGTGGIAGALQLAKSGSGTLTVSNANTFTGGASVTGGTLALGAGGSVGTGAIALANGTTFRLAAAGTNAASNALTLAAGASATLGSANLANAYGGVATVPADATLTISGPISASTSGASQFPGAGTVLVPFGSQLRFSSTSGAQGNGGASATFQIDGLLNTRNSTIAGSISLGALLGGGTIDGQTSTPTGTSSYSVGAKGLDTTFSGVIKDSASGTVSLTKVGAGTLTLSGANTYTGATTLSAGGLVVTGSLGSTAVTAASGTSFGGTGTLGGSLNMATGSTLLLGVSPSATRGIAVSGTATLNGAITVKPQLLGGTLAAGTYTLLSFSGSLAGSPTLTWDDTTASGLIARLDTSTPGVVLLRLHTAIQDWRFTYFGTATAAGAAADDADPDADGLANLFEYALGGDPTVASVGPAPQYALSGGFLTVTFNRIANPTLTYQVEAGTSPGSMTAIWTSTGAANLAGPVTVQDTTPFPATPTRYMRLVVLSP